MSALKSQQLVCFCALTLVLALTLAAPGSAQTFYGSVVGTISDATGAAVPDVTVVIINTGTSERRTMTTDESGSYQFVNLVPGQYRLELEKAGFKRFTRGPIQVEVQSAVRIDTSLEVGEVTQTVEVTAETPLLQTENASLGHVVEARRVLEIASQRPEHFWPRRLGAGRCSRRPVRHNTYGHKSLRMG